MNRNTVQLSLNCLTAGHSQNERFSAYQKPLTGAPIFTPPRAAMRLTRQIYGGLRFFFELLLYFSQIFARCWLEAV
jgi:hypothetical protein